MYPKIEVVDPDEWEKTWGYDPYGYPDPKTKKDEDERTIDDVWDLWPIIIRNSYNQLRCQ
jgi:hypothetical protein